MTTPAAVLFDLDGVLVDTVEGHYIGWAAVAADLGLPFDRSRNDDLRGVSRRRGLDLLCPPSLYLGDEARQRLLELKARTYLDYVRDHGAAIRVPGVDALLFALRRAGFKIGVASASQNAELLLAAAGLESFVDELSDGYFVGPPKPHPAQLLDLAERLGVAPAACVVVEDASVGFEAATAGGMRCLGVGRVLAATPGLCGWVESLASLDEAAFRATISGQPG